MAGSKARVAINGYGVIGKRVADAVALQDDMELVGVADVVYDYRIRVAVERGYPLFASVPEKQPEMQAAGIPVAEALRSSGDIIGASTAKAREQHQQHDASTWQHE